MAVCPYIVFNGNCREAVEFYAKVFDTKAPEIMTYGEAPAEEGFAIPEDLKESVIHASLIIEGTMVMFGDMMPGMPFNQGNNISLALVIKNMDRIDFIFGNLREGGNVGMEMQETFFSKYYGTVTDKFGIEWQLVYDDDSMAGNE